MNRIERIKEMEKSLNASRKAVDELLLAINNYKKQEKQMYKLFHYYESHKWLDDFDAYAEGKIPKNVKAGVLSEDLVYDLLVDHSDLIKEMSTIVTKALEEKV